MDRILAIRIMDRTATLRHPAKVLGPHTGAVAFPELLLHLLGHCLFLEDDLARNDPMLPGDQVEGLDT